MAILKSINTSTRSNRLYFYKYQEKWFCVKKYKKNVNVNAFYMKKLKINISKVLKLASRTHLFGEFFFLCADWYFAWAPQKQQKLLRVDYKVVTIMKNEKSLPTLISKLIFRYVFMLSLNNNFHFVWEQKEGIPE